MVTKGTARQSSRPLSPAGVAASASASASRPNTCGMPWAWIAIRLTARSLCERAELFLDAAGGQAEAPLPRHLDGDEIAVLGISGGAGRDRNLAPELFLVDRRQPAGAAGQRAENAEHAMLGAVDDLDDPSAVADRLLAGFRSTRSSARSPTPATSPGRARRGTATRIFGAAPCASSSHSAGTATSSPSASRPVMSASTTEGRAPARCSFRRRRSMRPVVGEFAQHALERDAVGVLHIEGARDLARSDLARLRGDEGEEVLLEEGSRVVSSE